MSSKADWSHLAYYTFCGCWAIVMAFLAGWYAHVIDWTVLGVALVCLMPGLCVLDAVTMLALALARAHAEEEPMDNEPLARVARLTILHLAAAGLSAVLLAVPASSAWFNGVALHSARMLQVALAVMGFLMALRLPWMLLGALSAARRR